MSVFSFELEFESLEQVSIDLGQSVGLKWTLHAPSIENKNLSPFILAIQNNTLNESLYLSNVKVLDKKTNGVIKGSCILTFLSPISQTSILGKVGVESVPISFKNLNFDFKDPGEIKALSILEEVLLTNRNQDYIYLFSCYLLLICITLVPLMLKRRKDNELIRRFLVNEVKTKADLKGILLNAKDRAGIEQIYKLRYEWIKRFNVSEEEIVDFFKELDRFQYKRSWSGSDEESIKNKLKKIQEVIKE